MILASDATSTVATGFLQMSSRRVSVHHVSQDNKTITVLQFANSIRVKDIAAMVQKGNLFVEVFGVIEKMLNLILQEGSLDIEFGSV